VIPRPPAKLDPTIETWDAARRIVRCHGATYSETQFNATTHLRRFRPFMHDGAIVPTMYGADGLPGALSETVFHDVPVRGPNRRVLKGAVEPWVWSVLAPTRPLRLVSLRGPGLKRVQVTHGELIECHASDYADTVPWADALHDVPAAPDGLCWRSRQNNDSLAVILFGTRVAETDLDVVQRAADLTSGAGRDALLEFAEAADIAIVT
jgi:RES domain-containing protein